MVASFSSGQKASGLSMGLTRRIHNALGCLVRRHKSAPEDPVRRHLLSFPRRTDANIDPRQLERFWVKTEGDEDTTCILI